MLYEILKHKNVVGFSSSLMPKIVKGIETEERAIRVYVKKKLPLSELRKHEIIPTEINGIKTDIVEVGEIKALAYTKRIRPIIAGTSIGNYAITAGTLGWFFEKNGEIFLGSNAHVFCENPAEDIQNEKRIVQPGKYDGGKVPNDIVAEYFWHKKVYPEEQVSTCPVAKIWSGIYNSIAKIFGAKTRLKPVVNEVNLIDFAVAKPTVAFEMTLYNFEPKGKFVGLGFAGSNTVSLVCKGIHIVKTGYKPVLYKWCDSYPLGMKTEKVGRTTEYTKAQIIDSSAVMKVSYGSYVVVFNDVIVTTKLLEPGDSGSSVWEVKE